MPFHVPVPMDYSLGSVTSWSDMLRSPPPGGTPSHSYAHHDSVKVVIKMETRSVVPVRGLVYLDIT
ncbi:hypothetical protein H6G64_10655 [Calothrix sp. FACHB-156]|nr:hypothetical protein [Calothrix sp. FACHB-156]